MAKVERWRQRDEVGGMRERRRAKGRDNLLRGTGDRREEHTDCGCCGERIVMSGDVVVLKRRRWVRVEEGREREAGVQSFHLRPEKRVKMIRRQVKDWPTTTVIHRKVARCWEVRKYAPLVSETSIPPIQGLRSARKSRDKGSLVSIAYAALKGCFYMTSLGMQLGLSESM